MPLRVPTSGIVLVSCVTSADKVLAPGLVGEWAVSDSYSVAATLEGIGTSAALGDVVFRMEFFGGDATNTTEKATTVVRVGDVLLPSAPADGLVVLTNTPVAMLLDCEPAGSGSFLSTAWHTRRLKSDGSYDVYKCNLFVAHRAVQCGLTVPAIHGRLWRAYPPLANEWGNRSFVIDRWECVDSAVYPQPGYVSSESARGGPGHMGIVDFDGKGISAGKDNVNRYFNACNPKTTLRKFAGGEAR